MFQRPDSHIPINSHILMEIQALSKLCLCLDLSHKELKTTGVINTKVTVEVLSHGVITNGDFQIEMPHTLLQIWMGPPFLKVSWVK